MSASVKLIPLSCSFSCSMLGTGPGSRATQTIREQNARKVSAYVTHR